MSCSTDLRTATTTAIGLTACLTISAGLLATDLAGAAGPAAGQPLPECTIDFDGDCPNTTEICGATFDGGVGCVFEDLPFCYDTGLFSYKVTPDLPATITLSGDLVGLDVFFSGFLGSTGTMRFFDADDVEVGSPLTTNGDCTATMPDRQQQFFGEAVRRIEVTAERGPVYIDTFTVNPPLPADLDGDGDVDASDLAILLGAWGKCPEPPEDCPADINDDGVVDASDLAILLGAWTG